MHDDQHGTAVVSLAAIINGLKLLKKEPKDMKLIINGAGYVYPQFVELPALPFVSSSTATG